MAGSKCNDVLRGIPLGTLILLLLNISIHGLIFITSMNPGFFAIGFNNVFKGEMYYTVLSYAFVHDNGSLMHIGFNMMSLLQLGSAIESQFGTSQFLFMSAWAVLLCGVLYLLLAYVAFLVSGSGLATAALGYSGVIYSYIVVATYHSQVETLSVFGFFSVPARIYPWVLLVLDSVIMPIIMPGVSFMGHLSGILVGMLVVSGFVDWLVPSRDSQRKVEQYGCCKFLYSQPNYIKVIDNSMVVADFFDSRDGVANWIRPFLMMAQQVYSLLETILHICGCLTGRMAAYMHSLIPTAVQRQGLQDAGSSGNRSMKMMERSPPDGDSCPCWRNVVICLQFLFSDEITYHMDF